MARLAAWELLRSGAAAPLRAVERVAARHGLDERDERLLRRLVGTEVRRRATLRAIVRAFATTKVKPELALHAHLGLVQLLFLDRVPDHAALSETGAAVGQTLGQSKVRVVNAILRAVLRARRAGASGDPRRDLVGRDLHLDRAVFHDPGAHPLLWAEDALSMPAPLVKRWSARVGSERALALAAYFLREPALALRVERAEERDALVQELAAADVPARPGAHPRSLLVAGEHAHDALASEAFRAGRLSVQGEHALAAAELLEARAGERVLELCAAPGGKSLVMARAGARVVAGDLSPRRLLALCSGARRLGLADAVACFAGDGAGALAPDARFDGVLVDAPCSNTGVLGARPAARWRFGPARLRALVALQARLLAEGAARVRPGGRLVWSTCSLEPEENARAVRGFLAGAAGWRLEQELDAWPSAAGPLDGGYAARLRREA